MPLPKSVGKFKQNGKFYTANTVVDENDVKKLVNEINKELIKDKAKKLIFVLTGTHGDPQGNLLPERKFFWKEDKALEGQTIKAVDVSNISDNSWKKYLSSNAVVILAWCYSEQSRAGWMKTKGLPVG